MGGIKHLRGGLEKTIEEAKYFAASVSMLHTAKENMDEKALAEVKADQATTATDMLQITALLTTIKIRKPNQRKRGGGGVRGNGGCVGVGGRSGPPTHHCTKCDAWGWHLEEDYFKLAKNKSKRPKWCKDLGAFVGYEEQDETG